MLPVADTFIRNNTYANSNFGMSQFFMCRMHPAEYSRVALLTFDLSSLRHNYQCYPSPERHTGNSRRRAGGIWGLSRRIAQPGQEGSGTTNSLNGNGGTTNSQPTGPVTWTNAPVTSNTPVVATPATVNRFGLETYSWDLTSYLQTLPAGTKTVSLAIEGAVAGPDLVRFLSHEAGQLGPQLIVNGSGGTSVPVAT